MKSLSETYVISSFVDMLDAGHINLDHFLQRESGQWSNRQKIKLIDTLLRGYPFPTIYAIKESEDSDDLTILDGKQRISALKEFMLDQSFAFRCKESIDIGGTEYKLDGMKYGDMPKAVQKKIGGANFNVVTFTGYTMEDVLEIFDRLNNGTPLTKAEKSKPLMGDRMIDRLKGIISGGFFEKTGMTAAQKRKGECYSVLVQCLMLMNEGATALSSSAITRFISARRDTLQESDYARLQTLLERFGALLDRLDLGNKPNPVAKVSIPVVVAVWDKLEETKLPAFEEHLKTFFETYDQQDAYRACCVKSTDKAQVAGRLEILSKLAEA